MTAIPFTYTFPQGGRYRMDTPLAKPLAQDGPYRMDSLHHAPEVALSRAWVLDRLMWHAQVCLGEIPLRLKTRKAHSADVVELETHQPDASAANRALEPAGP